MLKSVAFIAHPAHDMGRARKFYSEVLGLELAAENGGRWCEFSMPDGKTIALGAVESEKAESSIVYMAIETDDIEAEVSRLKEHDVEIAMDVWLNKDHNGHDSCKMAVIFDSEGNAIMLHETAEHRR